MAKYLVAWFLGIPALVSVVVYIAKALIRI